MPSLASGLEPSVFICQRDVEEGRIGSHPHLVHELLMALIDNRQPYPNDVQSANITCVGILAHESAMEGGVIKRLPEFTFLDR